MSTLVGMSASGSPRCPLFPTDLMRTRSTWGSRSTDNAAGAKRFGPTNCTGEHLSLQIGSVSTVTPLTWRRNVAWPTHVSCAWCAGGAASSAWSTGAIGMGTGLLRVRSLRQGQSGSPHPRHARNLPSAPGTPPPTHNSISSLGKLDRPWAWKEGHGFTNLLVDAWCDLSVASSASASTRAWRWAGVRTDDVIRTVKLGSWTSIMRPARGGVDRSKWATAGELADRVCAPPSKACLMRGVRAVPCCPRGP